LAEGLQERPLPQAPFAGGPIEMATELDTPVSQVPVSR